MHQRLWLSTTALLAWMACFLGCASGNSSTDVGGTGITTGTHATSTGTGTGGTGGATTTTTTTGGSPTTTTTTTTTTSSTTGTGGTGGSGTGGTGGSGPPPGLPLGSNCTTNSDCTSMLCKPVVIDNPSVCVIPCTQQSDCSTTDTNFFCEPITPGSTSGYCIPHSPAHCLTCTLNSDCGSLSETCFQAPGDNAPACNIDCSIAGAAACPSDYACVAETVAGQPRMLCRPKIIPTCLDAEGGYCDRLTVPQACVRTNGAGTCIGHRNCMSGSNRFSDCDAIAPQCLTDCSLQVPATCVTESYCATATESVTNCGSCGHVCPGSTATTDNVTCPSGTCTFSCKGESYDVNKNPADGCEVADAPQGNHTKSTAASEGSLSDCDSGGTDFTFNGQLPSDKQVHENPAVTGFDTASGSAPDWYQIEGVGHTFCSNDLVMQLCVQGSSSPSCYQLTVIGTSTYTCQVNSSGCCPPDPSPDGTCSGSVAGAGICHNNGGQFDDNTPVFIEVQKTCSSTTVTENVTYTVDGHF